MTGSAGARDRFGHYKIFLYIVSMYAHISIFIYKERKEKEEQFFFFAKTLIQPPGKKTLFQPPGKNFHSQKLLHYSSKREREIGVCEDLRSAGDRI